MLVVNLGGDGEIPDVINQQGPWAALNSHWRSARDGKTFSELVAAGVIFLICPNSPLPFPDDTVDAVYTNNVPIDVTTWMGPGVQSSEIQRILKPGGQWFWNAVLVWTKP